MIYITNLKHQPQIPNLYLSSYQLLHLGINRCKYVSNLTIHLIFAGRTIYSWSKYFECRWNDLFWNIFNYL